ncbi:sulfatase-like hydrolase/transferase [Leptospira wolffii]|uniref:sulfatase-like hydrolase/transferase n=1 Tax=Leptospira wolffii TaxID=409998 RepID=UPI0003072077|nr:sulfatase-like hydrolase/transferase [Leptospira wolffii]EPG67942.1 arylsulfatase [Leptospira wolffii serovar Khorat str. Khorat-H2]
MFAFWSDFKKNFAHSFLSGNPWIHTGIFVLSLSLICLLTNTSLHVMGVDISEFVSLFYGLLPLLLRDVTGILASSYAFFLGVLLVSLGSEYHNWRKGENLSPKKIYFILFFVLILLFVHSVAEYPQVYGEFFYYRHSWALDLLYFITDHLSPWLSRAVLAIFLSVLILKAFLLFWKNRQYELLVRYFIFIILFYFFHRLGSAWGVLTACFFYSRNFSFRDSKNDLVVISILVIGLGLSFLSSFGIKKSVERDFAFPIAKSSKKINVLILSADSIRQDQLGFVRGEEDLTPNIDSLAKESMVFWDHHTTIPRTFPAWADLLSGRYSFEHGIQDMFPDRKDRSLLGSSFATLPAILDHTHSTSVVSSFAGDIFPRANWGFREVYAPNFNAETLTQQRTIESQVFFLPVLTGSFFGGGEYQSSVRSLPTLGDDSRILPDLFSRFKKKNIPFFSVFFSSVTHFPYSPPYPFYKQGTDPNYYGFSKYFRFVDPSNSERPDEKEQEQIREVYRSSLKAFDSSVGKILQNLKDRGLYEETLIILTSDHGESLFEEDHSHGHGEHLRGEGVTKVPLLIKYPNSSPKARRGNFRGITSHLDILPTILSILETDPESRPKGPGRDLSSLGSEEFWKQDRMVYSETGIWFSDRGDHFFQKHRIRYPNILELHTIDPEDGNSVTVSDPYAKETVLFSKHRMVQNGARKLIYVPSPDGVRYFCYDRKRDPWNTNPLPVAICSDLRSELDRILLGSGYWKKAGEYFVPKAED